MGNKQLKRHLEATDAEIEAFLRRIEQLLDRTISGIVNRLKGGIGSQKDLDAAKVIGSLLAEANNAGLTEQVRRLENLHVKQLEYIKDQVFKNEANLFSNADRQVLQQLITFDTERVTTRLSQHVADTKAALMRAVITGQNPKIVESPKLAEGSLRSEMRTMLQGFSRAVTAQKAEELGYELFIYVGPDDSLTREFCADVLDRDPPIYTRDEIDAMDNDQGLPVLEYAGGYNCRHEWVPINEQEAKDLGWEP